jgi:tRNA threonylcarbamoyladenosine biosynthesis protein TsaE
MSRVVKSWSSITIEQLSSVTCDLQNYLDTPAVVLLDGEMGAGKTTFVSSFLHHNFPEMDGEVASPTYSIINDLGEVLHADLYRLEDANEIMQLELELYLDEKSYLFFEWGLAYLEQLKVELGRSFTYYKLQIEIEQSDTRRFTLEQIEHK